MKALVASVAAIALACSGCASGISGTPGGISDKSAGLGGSVISDTGGNVEYWAQYGLTSEYGTESAHQTIAVEKNVQTAVDVFVTGLQRATTYHYRICAQDTAQRGGPGCGNDRTVKTQSFACGETVTTDIKLTGDVQCLKVSVPGLAIGADGIDINLAGHSLTGIVFSGGGVAPGIDNTGGFDDVTIRNGTIGSFGNAVQLVNASRNHIRTLIAGTIGIQGGDSNEVRNSFLVGGGAGVSALGTNGLVVADLVTSRISVMGGQARIVRNEVNGGSSSCCVTYGIAVDGAGDRIAGNRTTGFNGAGILVSRGADNVVSDNNVADGTADLQGPGDGILVAADAVATVLRGNVAGGNDDDGFDVRSATSRLRENEALSNGDWGIDAVAGVTDVGGNRASGNGQAAQCRNVFCAPAF
jgi:hypothetical protein